MFRLFTTERAFVYKLLLFFLLLVFIFGVSSYYVGLGSDPTGIVYFARHLARGRIYSDFPVYDWLKGGKDEWGPKESYFVLQGNYVLRGGKMYCKYTIGFPLLLALSINLFGADSVYYANVFILLLLLGFYFRIARVVFTHHPDGLLLSVLCPILLVVMIHRVWSLALRPSRDLSALLFMVAGVYLGMRAFRRPSRISYACLLPGAFCLGFSASIRLPNVLVGLPAGLYLLARMIGKVRFPKLVAVVVVTAFFFALALGPAFLQNYLATGSTLKPPRPEIVERNPLEIAGVTSPPPLWLGFFKTTAPDTAAYFWRLYGPLFAVLILIGLVSGWRSAEVKYLMLGIPVVFILFYSMWVHLMIRYMLIAQPFLILLAVGGIGKLVQMKKNWWLASAGLFVVAADTWFRWKWRYRFGMEDLNLFIFIFAVALWIAATWKMKRLTMPLRLGGLCLVALALFIGKYGPAWSATDRLFQLPEARQLGRDIDRVVEEGSVIFATKPVTNYISLFSSSYSIRPFEMKRVGVNPVEGLKQVLDRGVKLYLVDTSGWKRDATKAIPGFREYFDVVPVGKLPAERYCLVSNFGKPVCTIYRIKPWSRKKVEMEVPVPPGEGDCLLMLNMGHILPADEERAQVILKLNGLLPDQHLENNINFIRLPASLLKRPVSKLTITSDRPLPARIDFRLQPIGDDYTVDLAEQLEFPDRSAAAGFDEARLRDGDLVRLGWDTPGVVVIPTISIPETGLVGEIKVKNDRNFPRPLRLKIALNGHEIADLSFPRGLGWQRIQFPLPERYISSIRSKLELAAYPSEGHRLSAAEEWAGALLIEEISVVRKVKTAALSTPREGYYYLFFTFTPSRRPGECPLSYRIMVNGKVLRTDAFPGVQRILLSPGDVSPPESTLRVVSGQEGCAGLIDPEIVLYQLGEEITIDVGEESDRTFLEDGFFEREKHLGKTPVRWTKHQARLILPLPVGIAANCRLRLKIVDAGPKRRSGPAVLEVRLDGRSIGSIILEPPGGIYSLPLPTGDASGGPAFRLAELELVVPTWQPSRYLSIADSRKLGIMLDWVKVDLKKD